jgi:hypothetical protein
MGPMEDGGMEQIQDDGMEQMKYGGRKGWRMAGWRVRMLALPSRALFAWVRAAILCSFLRDTSESNLKGACTMLEALFRSGRLRPLHCRRSCAHQHRLG